MRREPGVIIRECEHLFRWRRDNDGLIVMAGPMAASGPPTDATHTSAAPCHPDGETLARVSRFRRAEARDFRRPVGEIPRESTRFGGELQETLRNMHR